MKSESMRSFVPINCIGIGEGKDRVRRTARQGSLEVVSKHFWVESVHSRNRTQRERTRKVASSAPLSTSASGP